MDQKIIDLYDRFTHGGMSRRDFIDRLSQLAGSAATAAALLPLLQSDYAKAAIVAPDDARLAIDKISYDSPKGKVSGYLARPKSKGKRPAIVVIHQNRGLNPHIQDVVRRFAAEGYLALGPDLLSVAGGTPPNDDAARELHTKTNKDDMFAAALAAVPFIQKHVESTGKVGTVGFCYGGGVVDLLAMNSPDLSAAVAYYGPIPGDKGKVKDIKAALLLHYAGLDTNLNAAIPGWEEALKANGKKYTLHMYPNANHAFNDDTAGVRYNKEAADLAWSRTLAFFAENLGAPPKAT